MSEQTDDSDSLNYLAGKTLLDINRTSTEATMQAHCQGGVPYMHIAVDCPDEYHFGQLAYFLERACAASAAILGVNPFDQLGVKAYKNSMFRMLGRVRYAEQAWTFL